MPDNDDNDEAKKKKEQQQKAEAEAAAKQLETLLSQTRPKNLPQGVTSGVSNILAGTLGGVGIVVLAPTIGLAAGVKHGGILGGVVGLTGGAVVGALGGAAMIVGGALSGAGQMIRGVVATPEAIMAPRQGKWWNDNEGKWVYTDLPKEIQGLEGIPEDDSDILGDATQEAEDGSKPGEGTDEVVDMYYYDVLEVGPKADQKAIKRRYYVLARKYHPDKLDKDDKEGADKFKEIAEAYQVLSDPELRARYDKDGRDGLSADKTSVADDMPKVDPSILFAFLFGSDQFNDYVGRLATATSASVGDSPNITVEQGREIQRRRVTRLAGVLATKLQPWTAEDYDGCRAMWISEADELSKASYGIQLIHLIGQVYSLSAAQFLGSTDSGIGLPSISEWATNRHAKLKKTQAAQQNKMDTLRAGIDMMGVQQKMAKDMGEAKTDEEKKAAAEKMEDEVSTKLLTILWTTTVVDITNTLYEVAQMVLFDQSVDADTRKRRGHGLKALGEIFEECPEPELAEGEEEKDAKKLYEEAAFAAMVETVQRKDEAAQKAKAG